MAACQTGRRFLGIDLKAEYCDEARLRIGRAALGMGHDVGALPVVVTPVKYKGQARLF